MLRDRSGGIILPHATAIVVIGRSLGEPKVASHRISPLK